MTDRSNVFRTAETGGDRWRGRLTRWRDAAALRSGLGHAANCSRDQVQPGDGAALPGRGWLDALPGSDRPSLLAEHAAWLAERLRRHRGNADVVRQELASELSIVVSLCTVERAVSHLRQELAAEALATVRFETPPGRQLQVDFGQSPHWKGLITNIGFWTAAGSWRTTGASAQRLVRVCPLLSTPPAPLNGRLGREAAGRAIRE